jgi:hypothetical protein
MVVSIYSGLTDKKLDNLHLQLTNKYGNILMDNSPIEERRIALLASIPGNEVEQKQELNSICEFVKEFVYRCFRNLALSIYCAMMKLNDYSPWNDSEKVGISFCRNILNVPNDQSVTDVEFIRFQMLIDKWDKQNGQKSGKEYSDYCKNFSMVIFGKKYTNSFGKVNDLFDVLEADCFLWITTTKHYSLRFILGEIEKSEIEKNKVCIFQREFIRSPQVILSIAAEVYNDTNIIRKESLGVIFYIKWQHYYMQTMSERIHSSMHINTAICEGLKKYAMNYYGVSNIRELNAIKDQFIQNQLDAIVFHEAGHHKVNADFDQLHFDFSWIFFDSEYNVGNVILEILADMALQEGHRMGAYSRFLERGRIKPRQTIGDYYVYMSDSWFLDEEDNEFLSLQSEVAVGTALYFVNPDSTVNFDLIASEKDHFYRFFMKKYTNLIDSLLAVIRNATYDLEIKKLDFDQLELKVQEMHKDTCNNMPLEDLRHMSFYWKNVVGFLEKYSVEGWKIYQRILNDEAFLLQQDILTMVTNGNTVKYKHSLREYIVQRCQEIGIIDIKKTGKNTGKLLIA